MFPRGNIGYLRKKEKKYKLAGEKERYEKSGRIYEDNRRTADT